MKILEPFIINKTEIKNRMIVSAMVTNYCTEDGNATDKFIAYHTEKAKGGFGLIITEDYVIAPNVGGFTKLPGLWDDSQIESHKKLTSSVHKYGAKIIAQIYHAGRETSSAINGIHNVGPSAIKDPTIDEIPYELSIDEIHDLISKFGDCAYRAKQAGFDGVELHGAHGYLINQFMSPFSNKRNDEYGGNLYNRLRFALEIVGDVRKKCGNDFIISFRMSSQEYVPGGLSISESAAMAKLLEKEGVDCINCSQGVYASIKAVIPPHDMPYACYKENARAIKEAVNIPVFAVGRINDPYVGEEIVEDGYADACVMARASLADPFMPNKFKEGKYDEIIHCIACLQGCIGENGKGNCVRCLVNPRTGMEDVYKEEKANVIKKIIVVGGGVAGCEAAIVLARRGHKVTLIEKEKELGGQWIIASYPPTKSEFNSFIYWQKVMLKKYDVNILLNTNANVELLKELKADEIVVAVGSCPNYVPIDGFKENAVAAHDVLKNKVQVGKKVAIIGAGLVGSETADFLATNGHDVTLLEARSDIALDGEATPTACLKERLFSNNVKIIVNVNIKKVNKDSVLYSLKNTDYILDNLDTIICATGSRSNSDFVDEIKNNFDNVHVVGDAYKARNAYLAIREGYELGLKL